MAVNDNVYTPQYNVTAVSSVDAPKRSITLSKQLTELVADGNIKTGALMDNSNVYTTVDPSVNDLIIAGCVGTNVRYNADDNYMYTELIQPQKINLRLMSTAIGTGSIQGGVHYSGTMMRWSDLRTETRYDQQYTIDNPLISGYDIILNPNNNGRSQTSFRFVNDLYFGDICLNIDGFLFTTGSNAATAVSWDKIRPQQVIDGVTIPAGEDYTDELWETGYSDKYGYCIGLNRGRIFFGGNTRSNSTSDGNMILTVLCEAVYNNHIYYYTMPYLQVGTVGNNRADYMYTGVSYPARANARGFDDRHQDYCNSTNIYAGGGLPQDDYNTDAPTQSVMCYKTEWDNRVSGRLINTTAHCNFGGNGGQGYACLAAPISVKSLMQLLACTLIPYTFDEDTAKSESITNCTSSNMYIGITDDRGNAIGEWVAGTAVSSAKQIQRSDYIDPDYVPYDPFAPDDPGEGDRGDIELGTLVTSITSAFVTQYIINDIGVSNLGRLLWGNVLAYDPAAGNNMIDNFVLSRRSDNTDYDLNLTLSNLIDYFAALRYYPIPNLPQLTQGSLYPTNLIRVGTGVRPISIVDDTPYVGAYACLPQKSCITIDGGSVNIPSSGSFTDFEPNVSISVYVPFCGTTELPASQVTGSTLHLYYAVDIISGSIVAVITKQSTATFPVAILQGSIGFDVQLTGNDYNTKMMSAYISSQQYSNTQFARMFGAALGAAGSALGGDLAGAGMGLISSAVNISMDQYNRNLAYPIMCGTRPLTAGASTSMAGMIAPQQAFVQITRHTPKRSDNYDNIYGRVANVYGKIGSQSGYTVCVNPKLDGIPATAEELDEIQRMLASGIFV